MEKVKVGDRMLVSKNGKSSIYMVSDIVGDLVYVYLDDPSHLSAVTWDNRWKVVGSDDDYQIQVIRNDPLPESHHEPMFWTYDTNLDIQILASLDDPSLNAICQIDKRGKELCDLEDFWLERIRRRDGLGALNEIKGKSLKSSDGVDLAIKLGDLNLLKWISLYVDVSPSDLADKVVKHGQVHILDWIRNNYGIRPWMLSYTAARYGQVNVLEYIHSLPNYDGFDGEILVYAAKSGHLPVFQYLESVGQLPGPEYEFISYIFDTAMLSGNLELLDWLFERYDSEYNPGENMGMNAIKSNNVEVLDWIYRNLGLFVLSREDAGVAARKGYLDMLLWFVGYDIMPYPEDIVAAHVKGHMNIVEWAIQEGIYPVKGVFRELALNAALDEMDWLIDRGFYPMQDEFDGDLFVNSDVVKWLINKGFVPPYYTMYVAIRQHDLEKFSLYLEAHIFPKEEDIQKITDRRFLDLLESYGYSFDDQNKN